MELTFRTLTFFSLVLAVCLSGSASQRLTPPPPANYPVEANGRLYNLYYVPSQCKDPFVLVQAQLGGGIVIKHQNVLMQKYGPYVIQGNIEVAPSGCLVIMPGTELYFNPGYGIIVNGTLIARGSYLAGQRILMTKNPNATVGQSSPWPTDARLVDGNTTRDGRLDLLYNKQWRGVCTNYKNFTEIDLNVTCRHLGFVYGNFTYHSFARNETDYMLLEKPACTGSENSLFECPGSRNIKTGSQICDGQQVVGFECAGLRPDLARDHWRGIEFYNSTTGMIHDSKKRLYYNASQSFLEYVDISYAGLDIYGGDRHRHGMGTISASPYVPIMNNITVTNGAYDGMNLTEIRGEIHIANSTISDNRGYGMYIKTAVGRTLINKTDVLYNWGDGIKMYMTNYTINEFNRDYPTHGSFCRTASASGISFPIILHEDLVDPVGEKPAGSRCQKMYSTVPGQMITLHVLILERDPEASGHILVHDGDLGTKPVLSLEINNGSFPQSLTTKTSTIYITFNYSVPYLRPGSPDKTKRCKHLRGCIRFLMELTTNKGPDTDLRLFNATVANNNGYGVNMQDMRCKVFVNSSVITDNGYGAGLRVYQGAGEVLVNNTRVLRNADCGVNITYSGGYQLFNLSIISENFGYGVITEYLRLNRTRLELMQKIEVVKSHFLLNEWTAFRIGNYCMGGDYLFNQSYFGFNKHEAIEYLSCNISTQFNTNFSMGPLNIFEANKRHAVLMSPVVNTVGTFSNNTFKNHTMGVLRIDNKYDFIENRWYRNFDAKYKIYSNDFFHNTGSYVVNLRLTQTSPFQVMEFKFNRLTFNRITDSFENLNPRSKANSVIVVSSGNVQVQRNLIYNPDSVRDIATHLVDPSVVILANYNYWNKAVTQQKDYAEIYSRLFDQNDRYNLAELKYYPVLQDQWLYGPYDSSQVSKYRWEFKRGLKIGGVLEQDAVLERNTYHVDRDIFILENAALIINPGTVLEFESSIGMVVHGRLAVDGAMFAGSPQPITFKLYDPLLPPLVNRTIYETIRLVDGLNEYEGRLELNISGEVGTVCNDGWTDQNSALVCQQLGLTYNPNYGQPLQAVYAHTENILLSRVQCDELDTDILKCRAETKGQFKCNFTQDVFIRCQKPTWSGVAIPAMPRYGTTFETQIRYLNIYNAGLLDYADMTFTPGLRIDYNFYSISYLSVKSCVSDGINIKYSNPYSRNLIEHVTIENNLGNGILTRSPFLQLSHMTLTNNDKAGFIYDPMFTEYEALSVRNFIYRTRKIYITSVGPSMLLGDSEMKFITCPTSEGPEDKTYWLEIQTTTRFRVTVQILDYNPLTNIEKLTFYDSPRSGVNAADSWEVERDLVDFPIVSRGNYLTIKFQVKGVRSGRMAIAVISSGLLEKVNSRIKVYNATIKYNERGIVTKHYNNPSNEKMEIFHRAKSEEISFEEMRVEGSRKEAMFIPSLTKYHENFIPTFEEMTQPEKVGAITYVISHCKFVNNARGVHAEHNHVDFANNVWKWNVTHMDISGCGSGGFEIELPRVNDLMERQVHAVTIKESEMFNNKKFAFGVIGYYAVVDISRNKFFNNECLLGLATIAGMEKDIVFVSNRMENNYAKYVIDFDLKSHSEYSETVVGIFRENVIINNRHSFVSSDLAITNTPTTFTIAVRGVQNLTLNRNIFDNSKLQYELVAGVVALSLENRLDVRENFWGTTDQYQIKKRIFDFDDWNNYAIANYFPFLTTNRPNGGLATDQEVQIELDLNRLGGRIYEHLTIPSRSRPYIVYSDLTIMPGIKFTLQPGTELQFYPNVGILVLGRLIATGMPMARIKFAPVRPEQIAQRQGIASPQRSAEIKFVGGATPNEGFLEMYNASTKTYNIMCDNQFNEKTAEVVCRELGWETVNVDVRFTPLYDYFVHGKPMYFLKEFWAYSYYCRGDEDNLQMCMKRINYNIKSCIFAANYTFIRCGPRNLPKPLDYWGNIRFAHSDYEEGIREEVIRDEDRSRLEYVDIDGAGMLHGEKVGAIQTTYVSPVFNHINITRCVSNGMDVVAPRHNVDILQHNISGNLGYAVNILVLNGDSTTSPVSSFIPLLTNTVPYNLYGLVDICRMEKEIVLKNRLILFYKYKQSSVDCVKIIRGQSVNGPKNIAVRFLQFSMYQDDFYRNQIELFDGKDITENNMLASLTANSSEALIKTRFLSTQYAMTIHIHASSSYGYYGFIAEVVTIPLSALTYPDDDYFHNLKNTIMLGNQDGAILYNNVGEITPSFIVDHCWIENNGVGILNLTSPPIIDVRLQSTKKFNLQNTFINRNKGGMYVTATTPSAATKLRANITNNVFSFNKHGEVLNLTGHHYERFFIYENYIHNNTAGDYRDVIHVQNVVVNFTYNTVTDNLGHYVIRLFNTERTEATQEYQKNLFWRNNATALYRALIHVGSGNPKIMHNYMVNEECDFELESNPVNRLPSGALTSNAPINAKNNWWGSESTGYVNGKIWDKLDNDSLVAVDYMPIKISNQSIIYGKCAPGWFLDGNRCFKVMGAALPYHEAEQFCKENDGFLAEAKGRQEFFKYIVRLTMNVYDERMRVWVYSEVSSGKCSAFEKNYVVEEFDCYYVLHPFICEKDPYIAPPGSDIYAAVIGIAAGVFGFVVIIVTILACMWCIKSKRRKQERFERQESIRSSIKGSTIRGSRSTICMLSEGHSKRRLDSLSSSKYGYDDRSLADSQMSLGGVTDDESTTDPEDRARRRLRQRAQQEAEIARLRQEQDRYDRRERQQGFSRQDNRNEGFGRQDNRNEEFGRQDNRNGGIGRRNGAYKNSDDNHEYSDGDSDGDVKKPYYSDEEEESDRNSFTPVKFKHRLEKELDSIQLKGNGSVQYMQQNESGSVDMDRSGRQLSRSLSSFSQHDSQPGSPSKSSSQASELSEDIKKGPIPPSPLPMNIPTKRTPMKPKPVVRPVPAPRPKPLPSARSYGSKENVMGSEEKLNNLSQDELSDYRGSRDRLDNVARGEPYERKKAPSRENLTEFANEPYKARSRSRENLSGSRGNIADPGVEFMPRGAGRHYEDNGGRMTPIYQSKENLIPKYKPEKPVDPIPPRNAQPRSDPYQTEMYDPTINSSRERLYPNNDMDPGVEYMGNAPPQNTDYNDGAGVDYMPRNAGSRPQGVASPRPEMPPPYQPFDTGYHPQNRYQPDNSGYQPQNIGHQPHNIGHQPNLPSAGGYRPQLPSVGGYKPNMNITPNYPYPDQHETNIDSYNPPVSSPYSPQVSAPDVGVDYMPRNMNRFPPSTPKAADNMSRSRENLSRSRENLNRSRENLNRSRENLSRSREHLSRSREYLRNENDFSPAASGYQSDVRENSMDIEKPRQNKSIETEI